MKKIIICLLVALLSAIFAFIFANKKNKQENMGATFIINGHEFTAELASNQEAKSIGLGGRNALCSDCGMVFTFSDPGKHPFWMKDMKFPLDIIWVRDNKIVFLAKNVPDDYGGIIFPSREADTVLEINAGLSDKYGAKEGDGVELSFKVISQNANPAF